MGHLLRHPQVSLLGMPDFDYRLSVYHGDLSLVPGLDAWLRTVLGDAIFKCGTRP